MLTNRYLKDISVWHGGSILFNNSLKKSTVTNFKASTQEETHFKVMRLLEANPDLTQRELAKELGLSVGSINYCLKALIDKGLVKMKNFATSKNKFGYVYVLTPTGISEKAVITHRFLRRKMDEYEALKAEIQVLKAEISEEFNDVQQLEHPVGP